MKGSESVFTSLMKKFSEKKLKKEFDAKIP